MGKLSRCCVAKNAERIEHIIFFGGGARARLLDYMPTFSEVPSTSFGLFCLQEALQQAKMRFEPGF